MATPGDGPMIALVLLGATCLGAAVLVTTAYRLGRRQGRRRLPGAVLDELVRHKLECLGEPPERVALEMSLLFGVEAAPASANGTAARLPEQPVSSPGTAGGRS
jgi:hypothetical protein